MDKYHRTTPATELKSAVLGKESSRKKKDSESDASKIELGRLVVCAAVLMDDGHIITGIRHYSPEMRKTLTLAYGEEYRHRVTLQGFVDQKGEFMSRLTAWNVAESAGQIRRQVSSPGMLYSENLY